MSGKQGERELLFSITKKDFKVDTFKVGGNGGQKVNKTNSGVRITHIESGAVGQCTSNREQSRNKAEALRKLVDSPTFQIWHKIKTSELMLKKQGLESLESRVNKAVDKAMDDKNIKVEVNVGKKWVDEKEIRTREIENNE